MRRITADAFLYFGILDVSAVIITFKYPIYSFRYPLKVAVEGVYDVKLYPEDGETVTTLNFKRGIISALAVPLEEGKERAWNQIMVY